MSKFYLINDEQNYGEMKFGEGGLPITKRILAENKQLHESKFPLHITILVYIYEYKCATVISNHCYLIVIPYK